MHEEREFRSHARPGNHALVSRYGQRRATLQLPAKRYAIRLGARCAGPKSYFDRSHAVGCKVTYMARAVPEAVRAAKLIQAEGVIVTCRDPLAKCQTSPLTDPRRFDTLQCPPGKAARSHRRKQGI
jgi:hypothetical protein